MKKKFFSGQAWSSARWKYDKYYGKGILFLQDGERYEVELKDDKPNGQGALTLPGGGKLVGEFRENDHWNIIEYNKEGNITERWMNREMESNTV